MINVMAVYENGVLRPTEPLELAEGQKVSVCVSPTALLSVEEWENQIRSARTIHEWMALANACPTTDSQFDVVKAMNESRRLTGFRVPGPEANEASK